MNYEQVCEVLAIPEHSRYPVPSRNHVEESASKLKTFGYTFDLYRKVMPPIRRVRLYEFYRDLNFTMPDSFEAKKRTDINYVREKQRSNYTGFFVCLSWLITAKLYKDKCFSSRIYSLTVSRWKFYVFAMTLPTIMFVQADTNNWLNMTFKIIDSKAIGAYNFDTLKNRVAYNRLVAGIDGKYSDTV